MRTALTIAGSDSGGGAGVQADLKTFAAHGVFGTSAITAVTAQNTRGVTAVHVLPVAMVRAQIDAVVTDLRPAAVKIGMLATAEIIAEVARALDAHALPHVVLDPVMVAKGGSALLAAEGVDRMPMLLSRCALVTPNLAEAEVLTGFEVRDRAAMERAARALVDAGAAAALVKGGHLTGDTVIDILWDGRAGRVFESPRLDTPHTHGTGCTLSSAIAAQLALGLDLAGAVAAGIDYVRRAIASAPGLGSGHGPLNHFPG
jgi:hydroxymethylpyrimidine/phosphomethylpyrimidine kinase